MINPDKMEPRTLALELLKSIREIDCRIDELRIVNNSSVKNERRKNIAARVEQLIKTRFQLVFSLTDITFRNPELKEQSVNPFDYLDIHYSNLKRKIIK